VRRPRRRSAAYVPIALLVGGFIAIGVAIKSLSDATSQNADRINSFAEQQRDLNKQIADGSDDRGRHKPNSTT
jgi:hypothetical protein